MLIAFDLDGTLTDPGDGVTACINHTLTTLGLPPRPESTLLHYIGPPTEWIFADVLKTADPARIERAREIFGDCYRTRGFRQNRLYPDTLSLLSTLQNAGHHLVVVTSKSASGADRVIDWFSLNPYLCGVFGRIQDCSKTQSLTAALDSSSARPAVMIGDRRYDIEAARNCHCLSIGVTWGFGSREELTTAGADHIIDHPTDLLRLLETLS